MRESFVFILGAGASQHTGAPLMADFLTRAEDLGRLGDWAESEVEAFDLVRMGRAQLQIAQSKGSVDIHNLESVFGAFETAKLFGRLGEMDKASVQRLPDALRLVIVRTLERTVAFPVRDGNVGAPVGYVRFAELLTLLRSVEASVAVLTFNYDVALDHALKLAGYEVDYGLGDESMGRLELFKLHGSLNWYGCECGGAYATLHVRDFLKEHSPTDANPKSHQCFVELSKHLPKTLPEHTNCSGRVAAGPLIVPPTVSKGEHHTRIRQVWGRAARALQQAENIVVFGYSWPRTDEFFRHLYAIGSIGDSFLRRFWVFDTNQSVGETFKPLLGEQARDRFRFFKGRFEEEALRELRAELRVPAP